MLHIANAMNGLAFPHDDICYFNSTHAHNHKMGYFRIDSMPVNLIVKLLQGETFCITDATQHNKLLTDALRYGVTTFCHVFNRAIKLSTDCVCVWETPHLKSASRLSVHKPLVNRIRRLSEVFGKPKNPLYIEWMCDNMPNIQGYNPLYVKCHNNCNFDDKPNIIRDIIKDNNKKGYNVLC